MADKAAGKRWTRRRLAFLLAVYAGIFLFAELVVRLVNPVAGRPGYYGYPPGLIVPDPAIGHRYAPGFAGFFQAPRYQDISIRINSFGFRDREWMAAPDPARPRVMILGDSIAFGSPLPVEHRFSEVAEGLLDERNRPAEFCNCGVNGYAAAQYEILLRQLGPRLQPRFVLIAFCLNDAEPLSPADDAHIQAAKAAQQQSAWVQKKEKLKKYRLDFDKSYLINLVLAGGEEFLWRSARFAPAMAERYARKTKMSLKLLYRNPATRSRLLVHLAAMRDFARQDLGADLLVIVIPYQHQIFEHNPRLSTQVGEVLQRLQIPYVDLYGSFLANRDGEDLYIYQDDCHPGTLGHRLMAEAVTEMLARRLNAASAASPQP